MLPGNGSSIELKATKGVSYTLEETCEIELVVRSVFRLCETSKLIGKSMTRRLHANHTAQLSDTKQFWVTSKQHLTYLSLLTDISHNEN